MERGSGGTGRSTHDCSGGRSGPRRRRLASPQRRASYPTSASTSVLASSGVHQNRYALSERWFDASARIEDRTAAGAVIGRRLHPLGDGFFAFPQGSLAPQARAGSDRRHGREEWDKHSPSGAVFRQERAGRSQPRSPPQKAESGFRGRPPKRDGDNRFRFRVSAIGTHLSTQLRGV